MVERKMIKTYYKGFRKIDSTTCITFLKGTPHTVWRTSKRKP